MDDELNLTMPSDGVLKINHVEVAFCDMVRKSAGKTGAKVKKIAFHDTVPLLNLVVSVILFYFERYRGMPPMDFYLSLLPAASII